MATFTNAVINAEKAVIYLHQTELPVSNDDDGEEVCGRSDEDDGQLPPISGPHFLFVTDGATK
jgi:hypothetical protein